MNFKFTEWTFVYITLINKKNANYIAKTVADKGLYVIVNQFITVVCVISICVDFFNTVRWYLNNDYNLLKILQQFQIY